MVDGRRRGWLERWRGLRGRRVADRIKVEKRRGVAAIGLLLILVGQGVTSEVC